MSNRFTLLIVVGMILGIVVGYACHIAFPDPKTAVAVSGYISLITTVFLRLIKMIIAPLVFSTLVVGIAHMGDTASVGRIGLKTMGWFVTASVVSLLLGLLMGGDQDQFPRNRAWQVDGKLANKSWAQRWWQDLQDRARTVPPHFRLPA